MSRLKGHTNWILREKRRVLSRTKTAHVFTSVLQQLCLGMFCCGSIEALGEGLWDQPWKTPGCHRGSIAISMTDPWDYGIFTYMNGLNQWFSCR